MSVPTSGIGPREPLRTCIGCRSTRPQRELHRCALAADGSAQLSRIAPGRGAWVCSVDCARRAVRRGGFARAWRRNPTADALDTLLNSLVDTLIDPLVTTPDNMRESLAAGHRAGAPSPTKG